MKRRFNIYTSVDVMYHINKGRIQVVIIATDSEKHWTQFNVHLW